MSKQPDYNFKILLLGEAAVGKTSLVQRFVHDRFDASYLMTIGMEPSEKHVKLEDGTRVALSIWDLSSPPEPRYRVGSPRPSAGWHPLERRSSGSPTGGGRRHFSLWRYPDRR